MNFFYDDFNASIQDFINNFPNTNYFFAKVGSILACNLNLLLVKIRLFLHGIRIFLP